MHQTSCTPMAHTPKGFNARNLYTKQPLHQKMFTPKAFYIVFTPEGGRSLPKKDDRKFVGEGMPGMSSAEVVSDVSDKWLGMWLLAFKLHSKTLPILLLANGAFKWDRAFLWVKVASR